MSHMVMNHFSSSKSLTGESEVGGGESVGCDGLVGVVDGLSMSLNNMNFVVESIKRDLYGDSGVMVRLNSQVPTDLAQISDLPGVVLELGRRLELLASEVKDLDSRLMDGAGGFRGFGVSGYVFGMGVVNLAGMVGILVYLIMS